ncbi:unnamed protein product [Bursaphelenchus okinawaensis]|uniref:Coatomer subunit beta n=1 Tax=Bursaphelenchus okinawaensis TaxID=465554 RepID=A0A811K5E1_9BILA|nr:unnamed protein product [Bursaphelenchus okinawaensis]CAG9091080.1 unnamed protein product [Bursaphelenchus okinawaensis]
MAGEQPCYTIISVPTDYEMPKDETLREKFENGDLKGKQDALKKLILMLQQGEKLAPGMLMTVIRFCLPSPDHTLKKLLLIFWEIVPKTSSDGKLLHELILVCDAYRKDLQHPNEFIRGSTLRFLCKLREPELLEPLMPSIRKCLEHRHSYVRRNAVVAIFTIYKNFEFLISDGPELIANFLESEQDGSCKRNAFMMLLHVDEARALEYLSECIDQVHTFTDSLQLVIIELIYKVCHKNPTERSRFIRCVYNLLQSQSTAVKYESAATLVTLSSMPSAIKAAASVYIELIVKEADNNVKLIVLDRLIELHENIPNEKVLQDLVIDVLRVLSATDLEVRKKILQLALDLVTSRNVNEMVMFLKKEIDKAQNDGQENNGAYKQLLVRTLHRTTIKFPDVAQQIFPVLMEFLSDDSELAANDVLVFVREAIGKLAHLRPVILQQLLEVFPLIRNVNVYRSALWILGEFVDTGVAVEKVFQEIKDGLGPVPFVEEGEETEQVEKKETHHKESKPKQLVTADGTYATQSALSTVAKPVDDDKPFIRKLFFEGNFSIASVLATSLSKLVLKYNQFCQNTTSVNKLAGEALLILSSIIRLGRSEIPAKKITEDDLDRLSTSVRIISDKWPRAEEILLEECRTSLDLMLKVKGDSDRHEDVNTKKSKIIEADSTINFTQLASKAGEVTATANLFDLSLSQALGTAPKTAKFDFASSKLGKVEQLAGFSDAVYAEAYVNVNQYDIVLDVLVVNQTNDTLQNLSLEFSTIGDLKLMDKPSPITLAPNDFSNIKATIKVTSTENGVIFSTISYDVKGATSDRNCVYLKDIHIDIMDYIVPGQVTDTEFRKMWADFEWENKVPVNTNITDLREYIENIATATNMKLLTQEAALAGDCGFLVGNYCAHSIFGEDALANASIEKADPLDPNSAIHGSIRVRAKSQGMALSLGDKITNAQKKKQSDQAA